MTDVEIFPIEPDAVEELSSGLPVLLGGGATITAKYAGAGKKIVSYEMTIMKENGNVISTFPVSLQQGNDLIQSRVSMLSSITTQADTVNEEVFQSLLPTLVAQKYIEKLREMGVSDEELPKSVREMIVRSKAELDEYLVLGKSQIAVKAQAIQDMYLTIALEVYGGNSTRYNALPGPFKEQVNFILGPLTALAAQKAGFSQETLEVQRKLLLMKLMAREETSKAFFDMLTSGGEAAGRVIGNFFGAIPSAFNKAKNG